LLLEREILTVNIGPIKEVISYQRQWFDLELGKPSPYVGNSPEVDAAWDEITALPGKGKNEDHEA
jgi:hypothetical protein